MDRRIVEIEKAQLKADRPHFKADAPPLRA